MKKVILLLLFVPCSLSGQIFHDFETGSLSSWSEGIPGHWKADTISALSGDCSLHHIFDNPASGRDCIGLPLTNFHPLEGSSKWSFKVRHGNDPSATNNWALFLMSDSDPAGLFSGMPVSGFAAGVNLTGSDDSLRIWKIRNGTPEPKVTCPVNWQADVGTEAYYIIAVERSEEGLWIISARDGNNVLKGSASFTDAEIFDPRWLVLNYRYTATRDRLIWFDDLKIEGVFYEDHIPPEILECRLLTKRSLEITFNEDLSATGISPSHVKLNDDVNPCISVIKKSGKKLLLNFREDFLNKSENRLYIEQICDVFENCSSPVESLFTPVWAEPADIIISEIMADPMPTVGLPGKEYVELTNRTGFSYSLVKWVFSTENQDITMPYFTINPYEVIILCSEGDTILFSEEGKTVGLKSFPAFTDEGRIIFLSDSSGNLIHGIDYSADWYGDILKREGGWSLEMIDTDFPFYAEGNWEASSSVRGGTPGKTNSASRSNPDNEFHGLENVYPSDDSTINIVFSEPMINLAGLNGYVLIDGIPSWSVVATAPLRSRFMVRPGSPLQKGKEHLLSLSGNITDFAGNNMTVAAFRFGLPEPVSAGSIVFNELLFNPLSGGADFVELYNCSDIIVDASRLYLASINTLTGDTSVIYALSDEPRCILPGSYYVVTTDRTGIIMRYPGSDPESVFGITSLPSMPDDKGHLLLLSRELDVIDEVIYSEAMHYPLLAGREGVTLEKVRPQSKSPESMNWHSASEGSGWGTPGSENSVFSPAPENSDIISLSSGRISPDNDGYEDMLVIDLNPEGPGNVVTVSVFDESGAFVRKIKENFLAGEKAAVAWDATANDGTIVRSGIYIILIELYTASGKSKSWKRVCTVIR